MKGRSVARALPLFIRDYFKLDPAFFCSSNILTEALNGDWNFEKREFQTAEEKVENDRLEDLEDEMNAERDFLSLRTINLPWPLTTILYQSKQD